MTDTKTGAKYFLPTPHLKQMVGCYQSLRKGILRAAIEIIAPGLVLILLSWALMQFTLEYPRLLKLF